MSRLYISNMKNDLANDLAGWAEIIRKQGEESRKREQERKLRSKEYIDSVKDKNIKERLRSLLEAQESGLVSLSEFFVEIRSMAGIVDEEYIPGMDDGINDGG